MDDSNAKASERSSVLLLAPRDQAKAFAPGTKSHKKETDNKDKRGRWFLFFGVILPLLTVAFELTTRYCAQNYFDPFPSSFHVGLFCLIPLSNFLLWLSSRRDLSHFYGPMSLLSGMAMGIGCLYTLMFLPITPGSALYVLTFGFGLLGLAPLLSLPCSWMAGKTVCQLAHKSGTYFDAHQVEHIGPSHCARNGNSCGATLYSHKGQYLPGNKRGCSTKSKQRRLAQTIWQPGSNATRLPGALRQSHRYHRHAL
ncbi:MAG: hypothetical protein IPP97_19915 [Candidatus Obscuribacter sp.]|nr:hypothetical protein [Candidatus Obscuribacter sp.]